MKKKSESQFQNRIKSHFRKKKQNLTFEKEKKNHSFEKKSERCFQNKTESHFRKKNPTESHFQNKLESHFRKKTKS